MERFLSSPWGGMFRQSNTSYNLTTYSKCGMQVNAVQGTCFMLRSLGEPKLITQKKTPWYEPLTVFT